MQGELVVVVALGVVVVYDVLAEHEAVCYVAVAHHAVTRTIESLYLDICAAGFVIFQYIVILYRAGRIAVTVEFRILALVLAEALHVFIEEQRQLIGGVRITEVFVIFGKTAVILRGKLTPLHYSIPTGVVLAAIGSRQAAGIVKILADLMLLGGTRQKAVGFGNTTFAAKVAPGRNVLYGRRLEMNPYIVAQVRSVKGYGEL